MKFFDPLYGRYFAEDDAAGGGGGDEEAEALAAAEAVKSEAKAAEAKAAEAEAKEAAKMSAAVRAGIAEALASEKEAAKAAAAPVKAAKFSDPAEEAMDAIDLRDELLEDVEEILAGAPAEVHKDVKAELRQFKSLEALSVVKNANIHKTIALAAIGKAALAGTYKTVTEAAPDIRPGAVHGSTPTGGAATWHSSEQQELNALLGGILTKEDLKRGADDDRSRAFRGF